METTYLALVVLFYISCPAFQKQIRAFSKDKEMDPPLKPLEKKVVLLTP